MKTPLCAVPPTVPGKGTPVSGAHGTGTLTGRMEVRRGHVRVRVRWDNGHTAMTPLSELTCAGTFAPPRPA